MTLKQRLADLDRLTMDRALRESQHVTTDHCAHCGLVPMHGTVLLGVEESYRDKYRKWQTATVLLCKPCAKKGENR